MTVANEINNIVVGDFGQTIVLTCVDEDGTAVDVSAYTGTKTLHARSPDGSRNISASASFVSGGTDGRVSFAFVASDIDRPGRWELTLELLIGTTTAQLSSTPIYMNVEPRSGT